MSRQDKKKLRFGWIAGGLGVFVFTPPVVRFTMVPKAAPSGARRVNTRTEAKHETMKKPLIGLRVSPEVYEELERLSKTDRKTQAAVARVLIAEALARRAADITASQFQMVENRLVRIERRFSRWIIKRARAIAESLYVSHRLFRCAA